MEMNSDMGGESPGVAQSRVEAGYPEQFKDSLEDNERPVSNSSADSRGMDDSPVDEDPVNSQDSLNAEKQYQDDLKERVRQSFKDLGMEPEGVLKDHLKEQGKSAKSNKKQPASRSSARDRGSGPQEVSSDDGLEDEASDYADIPSGYADQPTGYANKPAAYANKPEDYSNEPHGHTDEPMRGSNQPTPSDNPDPEEAFKDQTTPKGYRDDRGLQNNNPNGGYPNEGDDPDDQTSTGYPNEGIANSDPLGEYQAEHEYDNVANDDLTSVRHPEEKEHFENNRESEHYPEAYPDQDQYEDNTYRSNPSAKRNSDAYPIDNEGNNAPDVHPEQGSYPEQGNYPNGGGYPEDGGYPDEGNHPQAGGGYPEGDDNPEGGAYEGDTPNDHGNNYTKDSTPPVPPSYPSRYDNHGYADDEEQYDDGNQTPDRPQDSERYEQTPRDSFDYGQPTGVSNNTAPNDSLDYDEQNNSARNNGPQSFLKDSLEDDEKDNSTRNDEQDNSARNNGPQDFPNHQASPDNYPQDSLDFGYPEPASEQTHPSDTGRYSKTHGNNHGDGGASDPAPYDSLDDEKPYNVPNKTPPQDISSVPNVPLKQENNAQDIWPGSQHPPLAVSQLQRDAAKQDGYSSNNSSANSSHKIPNGSSAGSRKLSGSQGSPSAQGSAGLQDIPPQGRRKTPSRSRSGGFGSRGSNRAGYSDLARRQGSANQKGSAGSDKSNDGRPQQHNSQRQVRSGHEKSRHTGSSRVSGSRNRARSLGNKVKTSPIPADELSAKELLKRTRSKSDAVGQQPIVEHSDSQIIRKDGEDVRVAYISDDSGDEGEHFLDEKGSPIDHFGQPLYKDLHGTKKKPDEPKFEFRIKPTPPKQKSPLELQTVNARRTSADDSSEKKVPHGGKITMAKPFPVEEPVSENTTAIQTGLLDDALPPQPNIPEEPIIQKSSAKPEGINESTLPPAVQELSTQKEETDSPSGSASNSRTPFREVRLHSVGTVMSGKSTGRGRGRTMPVPESQEEDPYKDLRFETDAAEEHGRENKAAVEKAINRDLKAKEQKSAKIRSGTYIKEDFNKPADYPPASRGASGSSYQDRGIQYTPQEGQSREPQSSSTPLYKPDPMVQHPYNTQQGYPVQQQDGYDNQQQHYHPNTTSQSTFNQQPGFPGGPQHPSQYNSDGYPMQQYGEQQPQGAPWNNVHPSQMSQQFYNRGQPAPSVQYDPQQGGRSAQEGYHNQPHPGYDALMGRPNFPQPDQGQYHDQQQPYDAGYQNYPSAPPQQVRPAGPPRGYISPSRGAIQPPYRVYTNQEQPVQNEPQSQPRKRGPPKPKPNFIDINKVNLAHGPPRKKYSEIQKMSTPTRINPKKPLPDISHESSNYDDTFPWAHEEWTRQLIHDQQNLPLRRGHSDTNLYVQNVDPGPVPQGYHRQVSMPGYSDEAGTGYPQDPRAFQPAYNQTYPPQMPRNQNGQPYSYSADHATQYARNNGFAHPQMSGPPRARMAFADDHHNSFDSDINPMIYGNEGAGAGYQHATKRTSPYHVLPDIPGHPRTDDTSPLRKSDPDSYTARLLKQKQPPQYKEYTLKDYYNLKSDIRLGGLGPDPELITEKQEKVNRQRDYAKTVMQQNKKQLQQTKKLSPKEAVTPGDNIPSKRDIGIEYSKKIPKPRMPTPPEVLHERMYGASSRQQAQEEEEHDVRTASEMDRLEELKDRHKMEKEEVERLRKEVTS